MSVISLLKTPVLNDFMQFCDILIECLHGTSEGFMFEFSHTVIFNV